MKFSTLRGLSVSTLLLGLIYWALASAPTGLGQSGTGLAGSGVGGQSSSVVSTLPEEQVSVVAPAHVGAAGTAMMASAILSNGLQQIVVYDPSKSTVAVYHVFPSSGDIQLKSVRRIDADFSLQEYNLKEPTPSTIRKNVR